MGDPAKADPATRDITAEPQAVRFADDGRIPNNPALPVLLYRGAVRVDGADDPAALFEQAFGRNRWGDSWRNGIYPFVHYHSATHEVLGIARGRATVQLGGPKGETFTLAAGDVAVLPAGTGHQCLGQSCDFLVVGAYPETGRYDLCRGTAEEHARAMRDIPAVPLPSTDPLFGPQGPLVALWRG